VSTVLILTATVGEGHDLPARLLAESLDNEHGVEVVVRDGLAPMGWLAETLNAGVPSFIFFRWRWLYDPAFWLVARFPPTRRLCQTLLGVIGGPPLGRMVDEYAPAVIVSTYPPTSEALAWMVRRGRLQTPLCAVITDLAALRYWAVRGAGLHLVTHPESIPDVRRIAGAKTTVRCVRGLIAPEFYEPPDRDAARRRLGLPPEGVVVLVSGGGWGVGDVDAAVREAAELEQVALIVCLCGRNEQLRGRLARRYRGDGRVRTEPFTDVMAEWMAAADALIHSTGGLTVLEAIIRGCPVISFGWGRGHVRLNNQAYRRLGLARVADTRTELRSALESALNETRRPNGWFAERPSAADAVLAYARGAPIPGSP
jgi:UDP-N-acetylglucosamine:LPS N-acetylglucosamine transferase